MKKSVECIEYADDSKDQKVFKGHTCVVITIANNPYCDETAKAPPQIMILSGYTGVATYAGINLLTDNGFCEQLQEYIDCRDKISLNEKRRIIGANILVS